MTTGADRTSASTASSAASASSDCDIAGPRADPALRAELTLDPPVGTPHPLLERDPRLPFEHGPEAHIVAVAAADALRLRQVVPPPQRFSCSTGHDVHKVIDRDQPVRTQVERLPVP